MNFPRDEFSSPFHTTHTLIFCKLRSMRAIRVWLVLFCKALANQERNILSRERLIIREMMEKDLLN